MRSTFDGGLAGAGYRRLLHVTAAPRVFIVCDRKPNRIPLIDCRRFTIHLLSPLNSTKPCRTILMTAVMLLVLLLRCNEACALFCGSRLQTSRCMSYRVAKITDMRKKNRYTELKRNPCIVSRSLQTTSVEKLHWGGKETRSMQLHMGLRSFLRKRLGNEDGNKGVSESDVNLERSSGSRPNSESSAKASSFFQRSARSGEQSDDGSNRRGESVKDRLNRMSKGEMTLEEKEAFLDRTLTWSAGKEKAKTTPKKTIRQSLPLGGVPVKLYDEQDSDDKSQSGKSPGISAETSWSHVVSAKRHEQQSRYGMDSAKAGTVPLMDDAAKEAWLNMVTSPTRFQGYSAVQQNDFGAENNDSENIPEMKPVTQQQLSDLSKAKERLLEQQKMFSEMQQGTKTPGEKLLESSPFLPRGAGSNLSADKDSSEEAKEKTSMMGEEIKLADNKLENKKNTTNINFETQPMSPVSTETDILANSSAGEANSDLAFRLEQAAILQEKKDSEARAAMKEKNERMQREKRRMLEQRQLERQRLSEEQETLKLRRRIEEERQLEQAKKKQQNLEQVKRKQLEDMQMEYWNKKLAEERAAKDDREKKEEEKKANDPDLSRLAKEKEANKIRMHEVEVEDERSLLQKAAVERQKSRIGVESIIDKTSEREGGGASRQATRSSSTADSFIKAQAARKNALQRFTQAQQSHLQDLNSLHSRGNEIKSGRPVQPAGTTQATITPNVSLSHAPPSTQTESEPSSTGSPTSTGISVGDLLSGRVKNDDMALDKYKDLDQDGKDMAEEEANKAIREVLEKSKEAERSKEKPTRRPVRQPLPTAMGQRSELEQVLSEEQNREDIGSQGASSRSQSSSSINISDEERKKANKWGVNLDKLL